MSRRTMPAIALAFWIVVCLCGSCAAGQEAVFRLAILSDRTGGHTHGIYPRVIDQINLLNPDVVVTVGDHIEGYGDDYNRANTEWDSVLVFLRRLEAPVHLTPGNHDIWDDESAAIYTEKTGRRPFYSFDYGNTHFVILDNSRIQSWEQFPAEQLAWLLLDLNAHGDAENLFVFFHKPFWDQTLRRGRPDRMHDIFVQNGVDAVFCGHYHRYFTANYDGIEYTTIGSSGGGIDQGVAQPLLRGEFFQFAWVTVTSPGYELAVIELDSVHPHDIVTFDLLDEIERIEEELVSVSSIRVVEGSSAWTPVTLTIENTSGKTMDAAVEWDVPDGWEVDPVQATASVPPGATFELLFRVTNPGDLYPVPRASTAYPLADGRPLELDVPVGVVRVASAVPCADGPTIDGRLTERVWEAGHATTRLYTGYGYSPVEGETSFRFAHDDENLYLAVVCHDEHMDELVAEASERDDAVYLDDCVGFFFQPDPEEMVVYQIYISPTGAVFDQHISFNENMWYEADPSWNGEYEIGTSRGDDHWIVEVRVPFDSLGADIAAGPTWGLNFRRKQQRTSRVADWQVPIDYDPRTYGEIQFE